MASLSGERFLSRPPPVVLSRPGSRASTAREGGFRGRDGRLPLSVPDSGLRERIGETTGRLVSLPRSSRQRTATPPLCQAPRVAAPDGRRAMLPPKDAIKVDYPPWSIEEHDRVGEGNGTNVTRQLPPPPTAVAHCSPPSLAITPRPEPPPPQIPTMPASSCGLYAMAKPR